jgi:CMP-N-acetylneuraminic acid synthetase
MRVLGLVPARGGSKGVPRKNIRLLGGHPLLQYTARTAQRVPGIGRLVLSTDDPEIAAVGRACGLEVPFLRPSELAADDTPMVDVVLHAVRWLDAAGDRFDAVCLLQPTTPYRRAEDVAACIELLRASGADCVVSVRPVPAEYHPYWVYQAEAGGALRLVSGARVPPTRRQELPPCCYRDGAVYVIRVASLLETGSLYGDRVYGRVSDDDRAVNINDPADWERAERLLEAAR